MQRVQLFKLIIGIISIILCIVLGFEFILGITLGMIIISTMFLFPSTHELYLFDNLFGYSKSTTVVLKNETENTNSKYKVRYGQH